MMGRKRKKLTEEQLKEREKKRQKRLYRNKIKSVFGVAGFEYLNTEGKHVKIGRRTVEVDFVFCFENIILICEDTSTQPQNIKDHIRNKQEAFNEIGDNADIYIRWLIETFPDKASLLESYSHYKLFNLYFSLYKTGLSDEELSIYHGIKFVEPKTLNYFHHMVLCIKRSVRYEIFRFLQLKTTDLGVSKSGTDYTTIDASIIYPNDSIGLYNGVRVVSFMMALIVC